jgi:DNA-binding Lrp family transcriptional regulator
VGSRRILSYDEEMKLIVESIKKFGPKNVSEIARETNLPTETVRYRIKNQLKDVGIRYHVSINYLKLGLIRSWILLDFSIQNLKQAPDILDLLSKRGYLTYFAKVIPYGYYISISTLPYSAITKYRELLDELVRLDILKEYRMIDLQYLKHLSLRPEFYDFSTKTWNVPWNVIDADLKRDSKPIIVDYSRAPIDKIDLLILKELQINALQSLASISKKINVAEKQVRYHYKSHLLNTNIIDGYVVRWQGDRYHLTNKYILSCFLEFSDLTVSDVPYIHKVIETLPFTWMIALSVDRMKLITQISIPIAFYHDSLVYLSNKLNIYKEKYNLYNIDFYSAGSYTLPFESFSDDVGWSADIDGLMEMFRARIQATSKAHITDYVGK